MLHFQKQESHYILQDFYCGVLKMDSFIKDGLEYILKDPRYNFYVVKDDNEAIVAMFVYSEGKVIRGKDEYIEIIDDGCPHAVFNDGCIIDAVCYETLEIDYLAVQEEYRNQGIGSTIISQLAQLAKGQGRHFLTVDAFHEEGYSAIPFYEKNHFIAVEDYKKEQDTQRMFLFVG